MKKLYINTGNITTIFEELSSALGGTLTSSGQENKIILRSDLVKGRIKSTIFKEGASYIQLNLSFSEDVSISIESAKSTPLFFVYCNYGEIQHSFGNQNTKFRLKSGKSTVINTGGSLNTNIYFKKNTRIEFSILGLATSKPISGKMNLMQTNLKKLFVTENENSICEGKSNKAVIENIRKINQISDKSSSAYLIKKDLIDAILSLEIEQYTNGWGASSKKIYEYTLNKISEFKVFFRTIFSFPTQHSTL